MGESEDGGLLLCESTQGCQSLLKIIVELVHSKTTSSSVVIHLCLAVLNYSKKWNCFMYYLKSQLTAVIWLI